MAADFVQGADVAVDVDDAVAEDVTDLFGVGGRKLLAAAPLDAAYRLRVNALLRLIDAMDFEIRAVAGPLRAALAGHDGFQAIQTVPGVGPVLAAIFVAETVMSSGSPVRPSWPRGRG